MNTAKAFSRTPLFWLLLVGIFVGGIFFTYHFFPRAFPLIHLDITIDRPTALEKARTLAHQFSWGPDQFSQTASFQTDQETKNFIELEGGGHDALTSIIKEEYYTPYFWQIRHFKEQEPVETTIYLMPDGRPYGFKQHIPEHIPGAALSADQAQKIATEKSTQDWHIDFSRYTLAESSQETQPSGRIDHTFSFERNDKKVGEAPYRLTLMVSGDALTSLELSIKVPEGFTRRYEHMRSANTTIAFTALFFMVILYLLGGCCLGLLYLARKDAIIWKNAIIWSLFLAGLQALNSFNEFPLLWFNYDTALSSALFTMHKILLIIVQFVALASIYTLIFAAAEGMTRLAFSNHIQLWKLWSRDSAASIQTLGRTIGGYLIIGFDFAFITAMYYGASRYFGWWTPSDILFSPNILATYVPWFGSIAQALNAGFMEECLFRAIPLAAAALIGQRYHKRTLFIAIAFIVQALIFGAAHANYPAQPAYARLLELIIPSFVFGGIYLTFGLLPAILSHFVFDTVWFALPLFISTASGIWIQRLCVIVAALIPVIICLYARLRVGSFTELAARFYNYAWQPPIKEKKKITYEKTKVPDLVPYHAYIWYAVGALSLIAWLWFTPWHYDNLPLKKNASAVVEKADQIAMEQSFNKEKPWKIVRTIDTSVDEQDRFVWKKLGADWYHRLLGTYISPTLWKIRFVTFEGDIAECAEEYTLFLDGNENIMRLHHALPEHIAGAQLSENDARTIAYQTLSSSYQLNKNDVLEISAVSHKHPSRLDWVFTFHAKEPELSEGGQPRIDVTISGDKVTDHYRYIFTPDAWNRTDRNEQTSLGLVRLICIFLLLLLGLIAGVQALFHWRHFSVNKKVFIVIFSLILIKTVVQGFNLWPSLISSFVTCQAYNHQLWKLIGQLILQIGIQSLLIASIVSFVTAGVPYLQRMHTLFQRIALGISIGLAYASVAALASFLIHFTTPLWPEYIHAGAHFPWLSNALNLWTSYIISTSLNLMVFLFLDSFTLGWSRRMVSGYGLLMIFELLAHGLIMYSISSWVIPGILAGIISVVAYHYVLRFDRSIILISTATSLLISKLPEALAILYPGSLIGYIVGTLLIFVTVYWWLQQLNAPLSQEIDS